MESPNRIHLVSQSQQLGSVLPILAIASGAMLMLPFLRQRTSSRLAMAAAGGVLLYGGVASLSTRTSSRSRLQYLRQSILVNRAAPDLTAMWRNSGVLDAVIQPFGRVAPDGPDRLRWTLDIPVHGILSGEAEKVDDSPGELVHWRTSSESLLQVDEFFRVKPSVGSDSSEVTLEYQVDYSRVPAGALLQSAVDFLHTAPEAVIQKMLHNFKSLAEAGETGAKETDN